MRKVTTMKHWLLAISLTILGGSMSACAMGGKTSWKEEVLLHDGEKLIVERSQTYGGRHEIGQSAPIREHSISFTLPNSNKTIVFKSEYSEDVGRANLNLLALHVLNGTPYIIAEPNLCLAYNKWGRPNPPYVIFKHDGKGWQRISVSELPPEFKTINLIINNGREEDIEKAGGMANYVPVSSVMEINSSLLRYPSEHAQYKTILREAYPTAPGGCSEMVRVNDGWEGLGFFSHQPTYEACLKYCAQKGVSEQNCPCNSLFKGRE
jgi:hypothetical protein